MDISPVYVLKHDSNIICIIKRNNVKINTSCKNKDFCNIVIKLLGY